MISESSSLAATRLFLVVPVLLLSMLLAACAATPTIDNAVTVESVTPRLGGNKEALQQISATERSHLQLIATNLVSTLVQVPSMQSGAVTLQINKPSTAYGNTIVRALEDAGFGLQRVSADQGRNYVSYSKRISETESGVVNDYELKVGKVSLQREFRFQNDRIYPSSLLNIDGAEFIADIELSDNIFAEQGGLNDAFISGVQIAGVPDPKLAVKTVDVRAFDEIPIERRTPQTQVFRDARQRSFMMRSMRETPSLDQFEKYRRTVLIFDNSTTELLGNANKQTVRTLVREVSDDDILLIKACLDADGKNQAAMNRAIRVEQELLGHGIPPAATYIAPCARASYRHSSDDSPEPVELVHYRPDAS